MGTYSGAPDECPRCWPNKIHNGSCLVDDLPAMKEIVAKILVEKGFLSETDSVDKHVTFSADAERAEGIVGYPSSGYICAELGPDQRDAYWLDYVWMTLFDEFPKWDFGIYNCAVLSIYPSTAAEGEDS